MKFEVMRENLLWAGMFFIVGLVVMAMDGLGMFASVRWLVERGLTPMVVRFEQAERVAAAPIVAVRFYFRGGQVVSDLQARLAERLVDEERIWQLEAENLRMRRLLGVDLPPTWKFLPAKVVAANGESLLVKAGEKSGVKEGMSVVAETGVLVGRVVKVSQLVCEVVPITALRSSVSVRVGGGEASGLVQMTGEGLVMEKILQEEKIELGDVVETSGEDSLAPGLLVARVVEVNEQDDQVYKQAKLESLVNPDNQQGVFVVVGVE